MNTHADKKPENENKAAASSTIQKQNNSGVAFQLTNNRPETAARNKLRKTINSSKRVKQLAAVKNIVNNCAKTRHATNSATAASHALQHQVAASPVQTNAENSQTGLQSQLKAGVV